MNSYFACIFFQEQCDDLKVSNLLSPELKISKLQQGCHSQGKISGRCTFFQVREKSGNLKINGYCSQSSENLFILFKKGKDVHSHEIV